jgi:hypothetical protein
MKGTTAGAKHLAQTGIWLAWWTEGERAFGPRIGTLMETALGHWRRRQYVTVLAWACRLPYGRRTVQ